MKRALGVLRSPVGQIGIILPGVAGLAATGSGFGGSCAGASTSAGLIDSVVKLGLYFVHERIWNYIPLGRPKRPEYEI